jgi:hypothetical protein
MATAAQVADRFGLGRAVSYARLSGLVGLGLLEHTRIFHGAPGIYVATRRGLASVGLALPPARVDLRSYEHDLALSDLVTRLEREFGDEEIATEREMRAADSPLRIAPLQLPRFAIPLAGARGQPLLTPAGHCRLHFPDCTVVGISEPDSVVAVELERTPKGRARLRRILAGYVAARHIKAVRYYVVGERVLGLVESEIESLAARPLVSVQRWGDSSHAALHQAA